MSLQAGLSGVHLSGRLSGMRLPARLYALMVVCSSLLLAGSQTTYAQKPAPPTRSAPTARANPGDPAAPSSYEVHRGDTLFRIANRTRPPGTSLYQMVLALYRANPGAFLGGNINQLEVGQVLKVPGPELVHAVEAAQAAAEVRALVARPRVPVPPAAPVPGAKPAPKPEGAAPKPAAQVPALTPALAEERYQQGQLLERKGEFQAALKAYLEAAEAGHGPAQKKVGDFYNSGKGVPARDYKAALKWYQKARAQGIEIPKPLTPGIIH